MQHFALRISVAKVCILIAYDDMYHPSYTFQEVHITSHYCCC